MHVEREEVEGHILDVVPHLIRRFMVSWRAGELADISPCGLRA